MDSTSEKIILSSNRALLFNIIPSVRLIFVRFEKNELTLSVYTDRELDEEEKDIYYAVGGEISGDFIKLKNSLADVHFYVSTNNFEELPQNGQLVYARHE